MPACNLKCHIPLCCAGLAQQQHAPERCGHSVQAVGLALKGHPGGASSLDHRLGQPASDLVLTQQTSILCVAVARQHTLRG